MLKRKPSVIELVLPPQARLQLSIYSQLLSVNFDDKLLFLELIRISDKQPNWRVVLEA
jgi:hypothetical protein